MNAPKSTWFRARASGVLAHVSSLPGAFGIGNMGPSARSFVDFLSATGFHYWQICPLGPTGYGDSPYQSFSSFAGNPYFIDLQELVDAGLLEDAELNALRGFPRRNIHYGELYRTFWPILERAADRYLEEPRDLSAKTSFSAFRKTNRSWLRPYGFFMGLKAYFGGRPWMEWPAAYRDAPLNGYKGLPKEVRREADRQAFYQYVFEIQWQRLRAYAAEQAVEIIGDLPIFVALDSSDTWQNRELFQITKDGEPTAYAGVPPDYFSEKGQFWGNPLYRWDEHKRQDYAWWVARLRRVFQWYDVIRLDHFRGFDTYWEIPGGSTDARKGEWKNGPGIDFFRHVEKRVPDARIIAEDLGYITEGVYNLRKEAGLPGMKILQFAYGHDDNNVNLPHFHTFDQVVYTGTHDNNTVRGWLDGLREPEADRVRHYFRLGARIDAWPIIEAAFASPARLAVIPLQDLLNLDASARMNRPGTCEGNWIWRVTENQLARLRDRKTAPLQQLHATYDRFYSERQRDYSAPPAESPVMGH